MPKTNCTPEELAIRKAISKKACAARYRVSRSEQIKAYNATRPKEKRKYNKDQNRSRWLKARYGMSLLEYNELYENQNGRCLICNNYPSKNALLCVDHDHVTGEIRGLLCSRCNTALGMFQDSIPTLFAAIDYLRCHQPNYAERELLD